MERLGKPRAFEVGRDYGSSFELPFDGQTAMYDGEEYPVGPSMGVICENDLENKPPKHNREIHFAPEPVDHKSEIFTEVEAIDGIFGNITGEYEHIFINLAPEASDGEVYYKYDSPTEGKEK